MKPGKDLDELVAQHVMGWVRDDGKTWKTMDEHFNDPIKANYLYGWVAPRNQLPPHQSIKQMYVPNYSEQIWSAWMVIEHLRATRDYCCISINHPYGEPIECVLSKVGMNKHPQFIGKSDISVMHAICLASLKAVGMLS
jgi:hypothetical protein